MYHTNAQLKLISSFLLAFIVGWCFFVVASSSLYNYNNIGIPILWPSCTIFVCVSIKDIPHMDNFQIKHHTGQTYRQIQHKLTLSLDMFPDFFLLLFDVGFVCWLPLPSFPNHFRTNCSWGWRQMADGCLYSVLFFKRFHTIVH